MHEDETVKLLNQHLNALESRLTAQYQRPQSPLIFIVGVPRSGTTLISQWLANFYQVGYINNLIAKFWEAPFIGASVYKTLRLPESAKVPYESNIGFTEDLTGPHEFGYFWKRWFSYRETHQLRPEDHKQIDTEALQREVAALEAVFQKPVFFKNPAALSLQIDFLSQCFPTSLFIVVDRDPVYNAQSLYQQRIKTYASPEAWFSVKPAEYLKLKMLSPVEQVAGQVYYTQKKINQDLASLPTERYIHISYESFCNSQQALKNFLSFHHIASKDNANPDQQFTCTNRKTDHQLYHQIETTFKQYL